MSDDASADPAELKRQKARKRKRDQRLRDAEGVGVIRFRDDILELADFLRDVGVHPSTAEDDCKSLGTAVAKFFKALRDARDNRLGENVVLSN